MIENQIYTSSCPVCARTLVKGAPDSYIEICCPKCRNYLKIQFRKNGFEASLMGQNLIDSADMCYAEKK